jgi:hypothetical protein
MAYWTHRKDHDQAWRWAIAELRPDVLLCQEAVVPDWVRVDHAVIGERAYVTGHQLWGTYIVTRLPSVSVRVPGLDEWFSRIPVSIPGDDEPAGIHRADGWLATARITDPSVGDLLVASVHSPSYPIEKARLIGVDIDAMKLKKNPDLWFLDVLFAFLKPALGSRFLVGGDYNYSRLLDETLGERGNNEFFDRIGKEGFVSLHRLFHASDERTYFHPTHAHHQLDYLYADAPVAAQTLSCFVNGQTPYSDHSPVIADLVASRSSGE